MQRPWNRWYNPLENDSIKLAQNEPFCATRRADHRAYPLLGKSVLANLLIRASPGLEYQCTVAVRQCIVPIVRMNAYLADFVAVLQAQTLPTFMELCNSAVILNTDKQNDGALMSQPDASGLK